MSSLWQFRTQTLALSTKNFYYLQRQLHPTPKKTADYKNSKIPEGLQQGLGIPVLINDKHEVIEVMALLLDTGANISILTTSFIEQNNIELRHHYLKNNTSIRRNGAQELINDERHHNLLQKRSC
eukprot:Pompholyxophrys_punicea_v1_NODE_1076_length_983_cov_1.686422.p1 type:complete len:125 gc:universal NODE_1076_length_983_cov_1.686422:45-419(+)